MRFLFQNTLKHAHQLLHHHWLNGLAGAQQRDSDACSSAPAWQSETTYRPLHNLMSSHLRVALQQQWQHGPLQQWRQLAAAWRQLEAAAHEQSSPGGWQGSLLAHCHSNDKQKWPKV